MIEIGHVNSLEMAARFERALEECVGEGFASFETVELEPTPPRVSSVTFDAERRRIRRPRH